MTEIYIKQAKNLDVNDIKFVTKTTDRGFGTCDGAGARSSTLLDSKL